MNVGLVGCGKISSAYLAAIRSFPMIRVTACADLRPEVAEARAAEFGLRAATIEEILDDPDIGIVLNLTTPQAHAAVNIRALKAGKHAYGEKPFAVTRREGRQILEQASKAGLLTGCAPDTFLGGGHQTARKLLDDGAIGDPVAGTAFIMHHGPEAWHPDPAFYYQKGGGPLFDMGPYYLTALVNLLGPVRRVAAMAKTSFPERVATSPARNGERLRVEVPTHVAGTIEFHNGTLVTMAASFDVWKHGNPCIEIHGSRGSLRVPDPNRFGGPVARFEAGSKDWQEAQLTHGHVASLRGIGVADLALAVRAGRPNRCGGELGYHVLDVMHAFYESAESGRRIEIESRCDRPAPLRPGLGEGELE